MPPPRTSSSTMPAASSSIGKNLVGDALYNWAREKESSGHVFYQEDLLASGIIPNQDLHLLLAATQYLVTRRLFKPHDIKGRDGIGWELIEEAAAANYQGLTSDEQMVYASIESAGTAGIWTKTIKAKSGVHAKVLDRVYKNLEQRRLIKPMKSVKNPGRKMYILFNLQPSEEATGGTWFNEGTLDSGMIDAVSGAVEAFCSFKSWQEVSDLQDSDGQINNKRKEPDGGFDLEGKGKARKVDGEVAVETVAEKTKSRKPVRFDPFHAGYDGYPTVQDISKDIHDKRITQLAIPNNALQQLLDVMVYDDRLYKMTRAARADETPDDPDQNLMFMYRCFTSPLDLGLKKGQGMKLRQGSKSAARAIELEEIGRGGFSEVPCLSCPVFDMCDDGGPVNVTTCPYFDHWFEHMEQADDEAGDPWPRASRQAKKVH